MHKKAVIIGGGFVGVATFVSLVRYHTINEIDIVNPGPIGLGHAFATTECALLTNTSVDTFSVMANDPDDFLRYLRARGLRVTAKSFVPRYYISQYARDRYERYKQLAQEGGIDCRHIHAMAVAIDKSKGPTYVVKLDTDRTLAADYVFICHGFGKPAIPDCVAPHIGQPGIFPTPYPESVLATLPKRSHALVLGTHLSAIDTALLLCRHGHTVTMASRSGQLPAVRTHLSLGAASRHRQPRLLTLDLEAEGLRWRFLRTLCRAASLPGLPLSRQVARMPNAINRLREEIRLAEQGCNHWQNLVIELQEEADALFSMTAPETRKKVFKCCWSMVQRYLFAFPLNNAKALLEFAETGALNIRSGKPAAITTTADGWSVAWENEAGMDNRSRFDAIICATGFHLPRFHASSGALQFVTDPAHTHPTPPHVTADLRVQLPHAAAAENIWLIGIPSYLRSGLISIAYLGVLQADKVARLCSQPLHAPVAPNLPATAHTT